MSEVIDLEEQRRRISNSIRESIAELVAEIEFVDSKRAKMREVLVEDDEKYMALAWMGTHEMWSDFLPDVPNADDNVAAVAILAYGDMLAARGDIGPMPGTDEVITYG